MSARASSLLLIMTAACAGTPPPPPTPPPEVSQPNLAAPKPTTPLDSTRFLRLANETTVVLLPRGREDTAQVQIGLLAGSDFGAPGTAELAAELLIGSGDATEGRASARQQIAGLGGTLSVEVNPLSTWITARVPSHRWNEAQVALAAALTAPSVSRSQIERVRDDYVLRRINAVWFDPNREVPRSFLLGNLGPSPYIASLLDRDASEVTLFASRLYRSDSTVLALQVPGTDASILEQLEQGMGKWPAPTVARAEVSVQPRRLQAGLYWAPGVPAETCRATVILPLPALYEQFAAEVFAMHACLTLDGVGGRLETLQRERGLGHVVWQAEVIDLADVPAIALTTTTTPANAVALEEVVQAARRSLADLPPTYSELQFALRRAQLTVQLLSAAAQTRSRMQTVLATMQRANDALEQRLIALAEPGAFNLEIGALAYLQNPAVMVVVGGKPPARVTNWKEFELLPPGAIARLVSSDPVVQAAAGTPWLDRAMEAVGGAAALRRLYGFAVESELRGEGAPPATERLEWNRETRTISRLRDVLGTEIETRIERDRAIERSGKTEVQLTPREVSFLRREIARHPMNLLAACARGELRFRPVAQRTVGDRDLMILEAVGGDFDRLRIHLDTVSHLIRAVELWETTTDGAVFHLQDAWSDYRQTGTMRVPFRRITEHDDGRNRIEAVYSHWQPAWRAK